MLELLRRSWGLRWAPTADSAPLHSPGASPVACTPGKGAAGAAGGAAGGPAAAGGAEQLLQRLLGPLGVAEGGGAGGSGGGGGLQGCVPASVLLLRQEDYHQASQLLSLQACLTQILGRRGPCGG
jgi:hypothetical protein